MSTTTTERGHVIITGAAHGIGAAYADRLSSDGYAIVIADLDEAGAKAKAEALIAGGGRALAVKADISKEEGTLLSLMGAEAADVGRATVIALG
jgi:3-oxoacyl-[acyl-carrier protein] reductase